VGYFGDIQKIFLKIFRDLFRGASSLRVCIAQPNFKDKSFLSYAKKNNKG
jgi:hypothetical protein